MLKASIQSDRYDAAIQFLLDRINYERAAIPASGRVDFSLDRMQRLMAALGDPQASLAMIHVAGTKGKGSTAAMIAGMLSAAGYRTGLYTSPHLERLEERIAIDGQPCSPDELVALVERVRPAVEATDGPTYFEITTAMAFCHFAARQVDAAVIEVGMGGRLDSTNVIQPRLSVITSISFDHTKQLGSTLAAIAGEKAGIIKPRIPVISGVMAPEAQAAIEEFRRINAAPLYQLGEDFDFHYRPPRNLDRAAAPGAINFFWTEEGAGKHSGPPPSPRGYENLQLALVGQHQAANAAVALAAVDELRRQSWTIPPAAIRCGLAEVRWPARVEVVGRRPTVVLDAAHNRASVASLLETLAESFSPGPRLLIFATTQDKQVPEMLQLLLPRFDRTFLTRYTNNPRGVPLEELWRLAGEIDAAGCEACPTPQDAWRRARALATPQHLICITGSFFLAAELRPGLLAEFSEKMRPSDTSPKR